MHPLFCLIYFIHLERQKLHFIDASSTFGFGDSKSPKLNYLTEVAIYKPNDNNSQ